LQVRQAADAEVGKGIGKHHVDVDAGVDLSGSKGGGDPGVAAANDHQMHGALPGARLL
jgi:hypothetical protein